MNILFYTPLNTRCRDIESQALEFRKWNHEIYLVTQGKYSVLNENFEAYGFITAAAHKWWVVNKYIGLIHHLIFLISYCWRYRIDVVYSHLEPANFVAVLAQYAVKSRVIICRHHVDEARLYSFDKSFAYRLTYKLAHEVIVVSVRAKDYMVEEERIPAHKIHHINLSYDFGLYPSVRDSNVINIREKYSCDILLLTICRLTKFKRPILAVETLKKLRSNSVNAKLIILGNGDLMEPISSKIKDLELEGEVILMGYVNNVQDYLMAADFLLHPSLLESSCISIKEAGLARLPVIVCKDIGDFNELIEHEKNGFIVDQNNFIEEACSVVFKYWGNSEFLAKIGQNLRNRVLNKFDIKNVIPYYESTFHSVK